MKFLHSLWHLLRAALLGLAALFIFIEEWGWRPLTAWAARLGRWPPLAWLEARIRAAPPRLALALFLVPAVALVPVKLAALWLIEEGRAPLGIAVIVAAKLIGTALVGRLFLLVETQLMQFAWFARGLGWWRTTKERVLVALRASAVWRSLRAMRTTLRQWRRRITGRIH
ncbi:MAG: hypothetical protein ABI281_13995 [Caldimonas sp.]